MSMYTTLLGTALDRDRRSDRTATIGDRFADVLRTRVRLLSSGVPSPRQATTLEDVTIQLQYDVALISLVSDLGLEYAVDRFDDGERHVLEEALVDRGVPLDELHERR